MTSDMSLAYLRTESTLMLGVVFGMKIFAEMFSALAEKATPLRMIPGRAGAYAPSLLIVGQVDDLVVGAPELEAIHSLLVLPLQEDAIACSL
eukprot:CAMPEP_0181523144 /NCGR_PEP_ID=MMETSP1110-20121109/67743_1 /TAXON_ID=174948 /ORGANISM="Symbiodinium sp., Strain CCMP421" /LENGTH=91 /DNA_ID=CAMNT_0023653793 /DNA_START=317 /DNA_END=591 /DNA_ORIENTATION=+